MGGTFILGLSIFFKTTTIGKLIAFGLKVAALTAISKSLTKTPNVGASIPHTDGNRLTIQAPFPSRRVCYGDAWVGAQVVWARNANPYDTTGHDSRALAVSRSAIMTYAICDHPIECWEFQLDSVQFLDNREQARIRDRDGMIKLQPHNYRAAVVETRYDPVRMEDVREITGWVHGGKLRERVNERRDALRRGYRIPAHIITKFRGNTSADRMETNNERVEFDYDNDTPAWDKISFGKLADNFYNYGAHYVTLRDTNQPGGGALYYGNDTPRTYWYYRQNPQGGYVDKDMHFYGAAMMEITYSSRSRSDKDFLWREPPDILLGVRRRREWLQLWDDTQPNAPAIKTEWTFNNAALCAYDYISRYTPYGVPVCGVSRIDLQSVARAADVCHQNRLTANGTVNLDDAPIEVLRQFEFAMGGGDISESGGVLSMHAGAHTPPTYGYDEDEIVEGSWRVSPGAPREQRPGLLDIIYNDVNGDRQSVPFRHPRAKENLVVDETQLVFVNNLQQAQRVAFVVNHRAWDAAKVEFTLRADVPAPAVWDTITVHLDRLGVTGLYRVISTTFKPDDASTKVLAVSERTDLYDAPAENAEYIPPQNQQPRADDSAVDNLLLGQGNANPGYMLVASGDRVRINSPGSIRVATATS